MSGGSSDEEEELSGVSILGAPGALKWRHCSHLDAAIPFHPFLYSVMRYEGVLMCFPLTKKDTHVFPLTKNISIEEKIVS